jgi:cytochrome P450
VFRNATADTEIGGVTVPKGAVVWLLLGSGNRDPDTFADQTSLDLDRAGQGHLAFGMGPHFCVGAALGRLEARIGLEALLDRIEVFEPATADELDYNESYMVHSLSALPLTFRPRRPDTVVPAAPIQPVEASSPA